MAALQVEFDTDRKIRHRNKLHYRVNHWPIWIFVFFIAPGPLTFDLFERGFDSRLLTWLASCWPAPASRVSSASCQDANRRRTSSASPRIARTRSTAGFVTRPRGVKWWRLRCSTPRVSLYAIATGEWRLKQMYEYFYFPIAGTMWLLGASGQLPRVKASTKGEGHERRYFYGSVWAVTIAQPVLWGMWKFLRA